MNLTYTLLASLIIVNIPTTLYAAPNLHITALNNNTNYESANAWLEIDKKAFEHNIKTLQVLLEDKSQICVVMKADAYGHGISNLIPSVIAAGIPCVAIASNEEAKVVRENGYNGRIMRVRNATPIEVSSGIKYEIEELFGDINSAQLASQAAKEQNKILRYHLGLNSGGMSRNGLELSTEEGKAEARKFIKLKNLELVGVMTHFQYEDANLVRKALSKFNEQAEWLINDADLDRSKVLLHTANSFTTLEVPEARLDMVRPRAILYGDNPNYTGYKRVMTFKTRVASVNNYPAGSKVGYDGTYILKRNSLLANLPLGYSDGYRRIFTNKAYVVINGHRAPVVGRVSMNTTMVDVTDLPNVKAGDEVVLFGEQNHSKVSKSELEGINGALLADLYTIWGNSNPKILKK